MENKSERCRWGSSDNLGDTYCVCDASEHCTDVVSCDTDLCDNCNHFFSSNDDENMQNKDRDTEELV